MNDSFLSHLVLDSVINSIGYPNASDLVSRLGVDEEEIRGAINSLLARGLLRMEHGRLHADLWRQ